MNMESRRGPGAGSSGSLKVDPAGRLGEPNRNLTAAQRPDPINLFCPGASEDEKSLRRRLHWIQGAASNAAESSAHWRARALLWLASQWAADATFRAPAEDLRQLIAGMAQLQSAARLIERTERPDE